MGRISKKEAILDAAEYILETQSYNEFSLDRIAEVSKVSKGGLLYHFPTKEAVISALVQRLIRFFDQDFEKQIESGTDFKQAFLSVNLNPKVIASARGLMAAVSYNPNLLDPLRKAYQRWDKEIFCQFSSHAEAWKFRIFFDGLFFCALLGLPVPTKKELNKIMETFPEKSGNKRDL